MKKIGIFMIILLLMGTNGYSEYNGCDGYDENSVRLNYRCGNLFIVRGVHNFQVLQNCGEPVYREVYDTSRYASDDYSYSIEKWVYGPEAGYYYILYFKLGVLIRLEAAREIW